MDTIKKEKAIEIIKYAEEQQFIYGDIEWVLATINEYEEEEEK